MIRAIPRPLLIHSAAYRYNIVKDAYGNITSSSTKALSRVRIDPASSIKRTKDNQELQLRSVLIYDARNSTPTGISFAVGNTITFNGDDLTIVSVDKLYDNRKLHHVEVGLI